jgi:D-glycero-D-manno-heptose 1,7-bisphosphate phosphatase
LYCWSLLVAHPKLILIDRDGVINYDSADYIKTSAEWRAIPGAIAAISNLQAGGFKVAICTNQAGIGRGIFDVKCLVQIHSLLNDELLACGGDPLDIFYCPHHPNDNCACRKPKAGLLTDAMNAGGYNPVDTSYVGDSERDLIAADNAGCHAVLVLTGNGKQTAATSRGKTASTFADLAAYASTLVSP